MKNETRILKFIFRSSTDTSMGDNLDCSAWKFANWCDYVFRDEKGDY